jgi:hypothetical protein
LNQIEANSLQFSEIHIRIFIIELVELQFKHKSEEIVRSQFEGERRREIEARSNQFEEEEDQNTDLFSVSKLTRRSRSLLKDLSFESPNKSRYIQKKPSRFAHNHHRRFEIEDKR